MGFAAPLLPRARGEWLSLERTPPTRAREMAGPIPARSTMEFQGPWPHPQMWWCVCPQSDCSARLYGPFATMEDTIPEGSRATCDDARHFAIQGEPPLDARLAINPGRWATDSAAEAWRSWWYTYSMIPRSSLDHAHQQMAATMTTIPDYGVNP